MQSSSLSALSPGRALAVLRRLSPLDQLQTLITAVVLVLTFRGMGSHGVFIGLWLFVPLLRLCFSSSYRLRIHTRVIDAYGDLKRFQAHRQAIPGKATFQLVALPMLVLSCVNGALISSHDNFPTMLATASLLREGNTEISEFIQGERTVEDICRTGPLPYFARCVNGKIYPAYPAGMMVFSVPFASVAFALGAQVNESRTMIRLEKWTAACVAALCLSIFCWIALLLAPLATAMSATFLVGLGSALYSTVAQGLWTQGGVTFGLLVLWWVELRRDRFSSSWKATLIQALAISLMLACRLNSATFIVPFGFWVLAKDPKRAFALAGMALLAYLPWTAYYDYALGSPLGPQAFFANDSLWYFSPQISFLGLLFSPGRGLLVYQPWVILALGAFLGFANGTHLPRGVRWTGAGSILSTIVLLSFYRDWHGGSCWGTRLLTETIPLFGILALPAIDRLRANASGREVFLALAFVSFFVHAAEVLARSSRYNLPIDENRTAEQAFWDWKRPPFLNHFLRDRSL